MQRPDGKMLLGGKPYALISLEKPTVKRYLCQR
jgi:hypothetical protein